MTNRYSKKIEEYSHEDSITNPKAKMFFDLFKSNPNIGREELAEACEVSRQTIQTWIIKVCMNQPFRERGKPRKFDNESSISVSVRLPESIKPKLKKMAKDSKTTVRQVIEDIIVESPKLRA